jgi:hypothetical protein
MKKIIFILIGIIIGSLMTLGLQNLRGRIKPSYVVTEDIKKNLGATNVKDLSTDKLFIHDIDGLFLQVVSVKNPEMFIFIDLKEDGFYQLAIHDKNNTFASFMDKDSDGIWDFRDFSNNDITYAYGRGTGYPDTVLTDSNSLVRIDDQYYEILVEGENRYIMQEGQKIEISPEQWGYFKLKTANQQVEPTPTTPVDSVDANSGAAHP